jgi:hypothetical protein
MLGAFSLLDIGVKQDLIELQNIVHGPTNSIKEYNPSSMQLEKANQPVKDI